MLPTHEGLNSAPILRAIGYVPNGLGLLQPLPSIEEIPYGRPVSPSEKRVDRRQALALEDQRSLRPYLGALRTQDQASDLGLIREKAGWRSIRYSAKPR